MARSGPPRYLVDLEAALTAAELDDLERSLDVAADLVPEWARRGLFPHERAARVNFATMAREVDRLADEAAALLTARREAIADALADELADAADYADLVTTVGRYADPSRPIGRDVTGYPAATDRLAGQLLDRLTDAAQVARSAVIAEADAQGVPVRNVPEVGRFYDATGSDPLDLERRQVAARSAAAPARSVITGAEQAITRQALAGEPIDTARAAIVDAARTHAADTLTTDYGRTPVQQAHAATRAATLDALPKARRYYASELLDRNTCGPCSLVDGFAYATLEEGRVDYPAGLYRRCAGGPRCRGTLVAVWDTEAEPTADDVAPTPRPPEPPADPPAPPPAPPTPPPPPALSPAELRAARLDDLATELGLDRSDVEAAAARLSDLKRAQLVEAARTQAAADGWLLGEPYSPLGARPGAPVGRQMRTPPPKVKRTSTTGRVDWVRPGAGGEWDWVDQISAGEYRRLQKHGRFAPTAPSPDEWHLYLDRAGALDHVEGGGDSMAGLEEAARLWRQHASLADAAGSVARGRPMGAGHIVTLDDVTPNLAADGWDLETILYAPKRPGIGEAARRLKRLPDEDDATFAARQAAARAAAADDELDRWAEALRHVIDREGDRFADDAEIELLDTYRRLTGRRDYVAEHGPAPWNMTADTYRDELIDVERQIGAARLVGEDPPDALLDRWAELVPIDDRDLDGAPLSPEELHRQITDLATRARLRRPVTAGDDGDPFPVGYSPTD